MSMTRRMKRDYIKRKYGTNKIKYIWHRIKGRK